MSLFSTPNLHGEKEGSGVKVSRKQPYTVSFFLIDFKSWLYYEYAFLEVTSV